MSIPLVEWTRQQPIFDTSTNEMNYQICVDILGYIYITYSTSGTVFGQTRTGAIDIVVMKMDNSGNTLWTRQNPTFNTTQNDIDSSICVDNYGNTYIAYSTSGVVSGQTNTGLTDIVVFKLDSSGNTIWVKQNSTFNTTSFDDTPSICIDKLGDLYVSYSTNGTVSGQTNTGLIDVVVFKMDNSGNTLWIKQNSTFNTTDNDRNPRICVDDLGNPHIVYRTNGAVSGQTNTGLQDIVIFKLDTSGNTLWAKQNSTFNTISNDTEPNISIDKFGNTYISYTTGGTVSGQTTTGAADIVVLKLDKNGNTVWTKQNSTFNTTQNDIRSSISLDNFGNIYVSYFTSGTASGQINTGGTDIVVFKLDKNGNRLWILQQPTFNTVANETTPSICVDNFGNVYVSYNTLGTVEGQISSGLSDLVVMKISQFSQILISNNEKYKIYICNLPCGMKYFIPEILFHHLNNNNLMLFRSSYIIPYATFVELDIIDTFMTETI